MNNLYQQLNQQLPSNQRLPIQTQTKQPNLLKQFFNSSNPQQFIQNMISNNPKMQNVMQLFNGSNMTPKQFFYQFAQQKGIDPEQFINSLQE